MKTVLTFALVASLAAGAALVAQTRSPADLFQEALHYEEAKGDLQRAIAAYQTILDRFPHDRSVGAKAQFQMALCYERLRRAEAVQAYERLIREYPNERDLVTQAKGRLADLTSRAGAATVTALRENLQVWTGKDVNLEGMPSRDGRYLSFVDYSLGRGNVAVRDLRRGDNRLLTHANTSAGGSAEYPVISPDGTLVAYGWTVGNVYSIRIVKFDGSAARVVATPPFDSLYGQLAWSPDGKRLAAVAILKDRGKQLALITVAEGSITPLLSDGLEFTSLGGFSADGRFLTFSAAPSGAAPSDSNRDVFTIAVDGSVKMPIVEGPFPDRSPTWTPDGRAIVFVSDRSGSESLWAIAVRDGKPTGDPLEIRRDIGEIGNLGFSRDGTLFYGVWINDNDIHLASIDPATLSVTSPPRRLTDRSVGLNSTPQWSPDGHAIAFLRGPGRGSQTIVIRSVADGVERTLPTRIVDAFYTMQFGFSWYPDSRSLLLRDKHPTRAGQASVRRIDVDSGREEVLFEATDWDVAAPLKLSPDGASLYYTMFSRDTTRNLNHLRFMRRNLASGQVTQLFKQETRS
jgi:Tol biopolymer transport system component